jgi:hypothetical protein
MFREPSYDFGAPCVDDQECEIDSENKRIVHYSKVHYIEVGRPCILEPVDHPSPLVSNLKPVTTSYVQGANSDSGWIETQNIVYRPASGVKPPFFVLT